jgi:hypothetical protein
MVEIEAGQQSLFGIGVFEGVNHGRMAKIGVEQDIGAQKQKDPKCADRNKFADIKPTGYPQGHCRKHENRAKPGVLHQIHCASQPGRPSSRQGQ